jgi:hypothetical protein
MSNQSHLAFRFVVPFSSLHVAVPVGSILPCIRRRKVYHLQYMTLIPPITSYFVRRRIKELLVQFVHNCLCNSLVIYYRVSGEVAQEIKWQRKLCSIRRHDLSPSLYLSER